MSADPFRSAAEAARALALTWDAGKVTLSGDAAALGLAGAAQAGRLEALTARVAPGDRGALEALGAGRALDARLRLVGEDGVLRLVRVIGRAGDGDGIWRGLILPAGAAPEDGLAQLDLEAALRAGLGAGAVIAHHQPIVSLKDRRLAGFEALARWVRADSAVMRAEDFLPLALERGLAGQVGAAVRACAAADAAAWRALGPPADGLFVAANASAGELCDPDFAPALIETLASVGLPAPAFRLEITETEVMRDPDAAERAMRALKAAGVWLALDDFGTGYSSLARLDRFPFDTVKIDRYFIRASSADASARAIITSVVRIAHGYAMKVVAEGVETEADAVLCAELGCDYGQGFRFARALAPEDAAEAAARGLEGRFAPAAQPA